jgi:hypothetical protein
MGLIDGVEDAGVETLSGELIISEVLQRHTKLLLELLSSAELEVSNPFEIELVFATELGMVEAELVVLLRLCLSDWGHTTYSTPCGLVETKSHS